MARRQGQQKPAAVKKARCLVKKERCTRVGIISNSNSTCSRNDDGIVADAHLHEAALNEAESRDCATVLARANKDDLPGIVGSDINARKHSRIFVIVAIKEHFGIVLLEVPI